MINSVAIVQGSYFLFTGVWPLVSIDTFQEATGPKNDIWLARMAGVSVAAMGAALVVAGMKSDFTPAIIMLGVASALGLACIDIFYVMKRVIAPVYLGDAVVQTTLIAWWAAALAEL